MLDEMLRDNWVYERMLAEGRMEGRKEGRMEGQIKGREEGQMEERRRSIERERQTIEQCVEKSFPALLPWIKVAVAQINDIDALQKIIISLFTAHTEKEVIAAFSVAASGIQRD